MNSSSPVSFILRSASGIIGLALVVSAILGALWGFFLPSYTVNLAGDGVYSPGADFGSRDFGYYLTFVVITAILGGLIGAGLDSVLISWPPLGVQLAAIAVALAVSVEFLLIGNLVAGSLLDISALYGPAGTTATVKTSIAGAGGYFWAPLVAAAIWWVRQWPDTMTETTNSHVDDVHVEDNDLVESE